MTYDGALPVFVETTRSSRAFIPSVWLVGSKSPKYAITGTTVSTCVTTKSTWPGRPPRSPSRQEMEPGAPGRFRAGSTPAEKRRSTLSSRWHPQQRGATAQRRKRRSCLPSAYLAPPRSNRPNVITFVPTLVLPEARSEPECPLETRMSKRCEQGSARASSSAPRSRAGRARSARCRAGARPRGSRAPDQHDLPRHARNDNLVGMGIPREYGARPHYRDSRHEVRRLVRRRPEKIRHVARRLVEARERASAWWRPSRQWATRRMRCSSSPAASLPNHTRAELDMLLSTGEHIAVCAPGDGGTRPRPRGRLLHRLAGGDHHRPGAHEAKIREITPVRVVEALDRGRSSSSPASRASHGTRWT